MLSPRLQLRILTVALLGLALVPGCSADKSDSGAPRLLGLWNQELAADNGLSLTANPATVVIDPADPAVPTDPDHGNERYSETELLVLARAEDGAPQPDLDLTFTASAGVLASAGATVSTDTAGRAADKLRLYASDPGSIQVSVSDGTRITTIVVTKVVAEPPVAHAGPDQTVECMGDSSAQVHLDGSGSIDPNSDIALYEWYEHFGTTQEVLLDKGHTADVVLSLGPHVITLRVTDATGKSSTDEVAVNVVDTRPPVVTVSVTPSALWPANHKLVHVEARVRVQECRSYTVSLESIQSDEPDDGLGDGDTAGDTQGAELGSADHNFELRAERSGGGKGRTYTVTYRVVDAGGMETVAKARVFVRHDPGQH